MSIVYRSVKGSKLTSAEVDGNFQYLENLVGGAGNAITTQTGFSLIGQDLTINANWVWQILNISYTNASSVLINIPFASSGNQRIDLIVANQSNTFERIAGIESVSNPSAPYVPTNKIFVTFITVTDGTLSSPTPPITGSQFKQKNESRKFSAVLSGTDQVIEFRTAGHQHYEISGTVTSVVGFGKTLLLASPSAEIPYAGKDIFFENNSGHDITLKDNFSGVDVKFNLGADLVVPTNGIVWLKYNATAETLDLFFKSWTNIDLSNKLDKVSTAGVERAYIINSDGSQSTKATSEFGGTTPTLQQVTDIGSTTTNDITIESASYYSLLTSGGLNIHNTTTLDNISISPIEISLRDDVYSSYILARTRTQNTDFYFEDEGGSKSIATREWVNDNIVDIPSKTSFTHDILAANWTLVSGKYEAVISNAGILANSFVDVIPSNDHVDIVRSAQIYPSVLISEGSVKVYSKFLPSGTISVTVNII